MSGLITLYATIVYKYIMNEIVSKHKKLYTQAKNTYRAGL